MIGALRALWRVSPAAMCLWVLWALPCGPDDHRAHAQLPPVQLPPVQLLPVQPLPTRIARRPLTEVARARVEVDEAAWARRGLSGRGSALCLVDTGIDAGLETFRRANGESRIRWLLDVGGAARGLWPELETLGGGAVWRGSELGPEGPEMFGPGDLQGHGTAMASISVGDDGGERNGPGAGLAPEAALIVVRAYDPAAGGFPDEAVLRGLRFCRAVAAIDEMLSLDRMVGLLSLGGHDGDHGGRGAFERALAEQTLAMPIVVAAGNDGERAIHAAGRLWPGQLSGQARPPSELGLQLPSTAGTTQSRVRLHFIADQSSIVSASTPLQIELVGPGGMHAGSFQQGLSEEAELDGTHIRALVDADRPELLALELSRPGPLPAGSYRILLSGEGLFDAWIVDAELGASFLPAIFTGPYVVHGEEITIPGTTPELITVGASVSPRRVELATGRQLDPEGPVGLPADYSARGPNSGGFPKPDLSAPGGWILAALSRQMRADDPNNMVGGRLERFLSRDGRVALRGTSVSAAIVAGALLLALELDPTPSPESRRRLLFSARGHAYDRATGYGELSVEALLRDWEHGRSSAAGIAHDGVTLRGTRDFSPADQGFWLTGRVEDENGAPGYGDLLLSGPFEESEISVNNGMLEVFLTPGSVQYGVPMRADLRDQRGSLTTALVPVVPERNGLGELEAVGGCALSPSTGASSKGRPWWAVAVSAFMVWARRRARRLRHQARRQRLGPVPGRG